MLRSDNEPAILAQVTEALRGLRVQLMGLESVSSEGTAPYDPQTTGAVEVAVQNVKNSVRADILKLESRLQPKIPHGHAVLTWSIRHLAILRTMRMRSADGASAWERVRGTPCSAKLLGVGGLCRYKCCSHEGTIA